jgi:ATP-binding cassette, subfamily B, bacterial
VRSIIRILGSARDLWPYYAGIIACSLAVAATSLLTPFIIKAATDYVVAATQGQAATGISTVVWLAAALLLADLTNTVLSNIGGYLGDTMAAKLRAALSGKYLPDSATSTASSPAP